MLCEAKEYSCECPQEDCHKCFPDEVDGHDEWAEIQEENGIFWLDFSRIGEYWILAKDCTWNYTAKGYKLVAEKTVCKLVIKK